MQKLCKIHGVTGSQNAKDEKSGALSKAPYIAYRKSLMEQGHNRPYGKDGTSRSALTRAIRLSARRISPPLPARKCCRWE